MTDDLRLIREAHCRRHGHTHGPAPEPGCLVEAYWEAVCRREGHAHGRDGLAECMMRRAAR